MHSTFCSSLLRTTLLTVFAVALDVTYPTAACYPRTAHALSAEAHRIGRRSKSEFADAQLGFHGAAGDHRRFVAGKCFCVAYLVQAARGGKDGGIRSVALVPGARRPVTPRASHFRVSPKRAWPDQRCESGDIRKQQAVASGRGG